MGKWRRGKRVFHEDNVCGIYYILNNITGKIYIGSSLGVRARLKGQIYLLRNNKHYNKLLQGDWNHYGESNFSLSLLCQVSGPVSLADIEAQWINLYKSYLPEFGYNLSRITSRWQDRVSRNLISA